MDGLGVPPPVYHKDILSLPVSDHGVVKSQKVLTFRTASAIFKSFI